MSNKLFREDFKFRVIVLANIVELYDFVDKDQLTEELGGDLPYCHHTWIQNRIVSLINNFRNVLFNYMMIKKFKNQSLGRI